MKRASPLIHRLYHGLGPHSDTPAYIIISRLFKFLLIQPLYQMPKNGFLSLNSVPAFLFTDKRVMENIPPKLSS